MTANQSAGAVKTEQMEHTIITFPIQWCARRSRDSTSTLVVWPRRSRCQFCHPSGVCPAVVGFLFYSCGVTPAVVVCGRARPPGTHQWVGNPSQHRRGTPGCMKTEPPGTPWDPPGPHPTAGHTTRKEDAAGTHWRHRR